MFNTFNVFESHYAIFFFFFFDKIDGGFSFCLATRTGLLYLSSMSQNAIPIESGFNSESRVFKNEKFLQNATNSNFQSGFDISIDLLKKNSSKT